MKLAKILSSAILGAVLSGTSVLAQQVSTEYDHAVQFNKLKSYSWAKVQASDPLLKPRITAAVDRIMTNLGYHVVSKNPDFSIVAVDTMSDPQQYQKVYASLTALDWRRSWGGGGFTDSIASLQQIPAGTFILDMYMPSTAKLIWRGTSTEAPEAKERKKEDEIDKTAGAMLKNFPPKTEKVAGSPAPAPDSASSAPMTGAH